MVKKGAKAKLIPASKKATAKKKPAKKVKTPETALRPSEVKEMRRIQIEDEKKQILKRLEAVKKKTHVIDGKEYVSASQFAEVTGMGLSGVRKKRHKGEIRSVTVLGKKSVSILFVDLQECVNDIVYGDKHSGRPICGFKRD